MRVAAYAVRQKLLCIIGCKWKGLKGSYLSAQSIAPNLSVIERQTSIAKNIYWNPCYCKFRTVTRWGVYTTYSQNLVHYCLLLSTKSSFLRKRLLFTGGYYYSASVNVYVSRNCRRCVFVKANSLSYFVL